ncbi:hypothetical protein RUM44_000907 [Polyplax serrata]|uniref:Calcium homeostasis endoplasmic reticulum protein n=1 Tax=Polyplax serrata TaxID=468196 RepID=A0ABR1B8Y9_POLSC
MELPQPPNDVELRNIIDKLAQFVARNGVEFEQMTKSKQKGNPRFSFLFGGDHFNYYQYKVTTEQAILKAKAVRDNIQQIGNQSQPPIAGGGNSQQNLPSLLGPQSSLFGSNNQSLSANSQNTPTPLQIINAAASATQWLVNHQQQAAVASSGQTTMNSIIEQQSTLNQQITQSEQNLAAQHSVLMQNQQTQIEEAIRKSQAESLSKRAVEHNVNLQDFDSILQPIIDSCTKDSISSGKAWILNKNTSEAHQIISQYLMSKVVAPNAPFSQKLHIIYLINDVMHHCVRKNAEDLKKSLEEVVVPMFCSTSIGISEDHKTKLNKLINLWEAKNNYFSSDIIAKLKTPEKSWAEYKTNLIAQNANIVNSISLATKASFENYQSQHQAFINHALQQIQSLENQKLQIEQQNNEVKNQFQVQQNSINQVPIIPNVDPSLSNQPPVMSQPPPNMDTQSLTNDVNIPMKFDAPPPLLMSNPIPPPIDNVNFSQPPPTMFQHLPPDLIPDFTKPPPGFPSKENVPDDLVPSVPYFELPAGLMVPLIKLDDSNYKVLHPDKIRLPPAVPPTERLIQAVEAFYQTQRNTNSNTRERLILDADGWEKLGLYEYYKAKNAARKKKEEDIQNGLREKSRSPTPIKREKSKSPSPKRKRYRSKSRSKSRERERERERDRDRSRSASRSPVRHHRSSNGRRSPRKSMSSRSYNKSRSRSRSVSPPPRNRSPTPPSFSGSNYGKLEQHLDESNKGHQMLRKMGWSGAGLGSKEQGIEAPISGGEVRDRVDQYKGVGVSLHDPYENFRKSKGQAFITRMKARAEERMSSS